MHRALLMLLLAGNASVTAAQSSATCTAPVIHDAKLREIAIAEKEKRAKGASKRNWQFEVSREGCSYRVFARELPERVAAHFSVLIDPSGQVVRYFGGM